jgi:hypothetical protein
VDEPSNLGARGFLLDFLNANAGSSDEIPPPAIVWLGFVFLPLFKRWPAAEQNVFPPDLCPND